MITKRFGQLVNAYSHILFFLYNDFDDFELTPTLLSLSLSLVHLLTHSTYSLAHTLTHSLTHLHPPTHSLTHSSLTHQLTHPEALRDPATLKVGYQAGITFADDDVVLGMSHLTLLTSSSGIVSKERDPTCTLHTLTDRRTYTYAPKHLLFCADTP